MRTLLMSSLVFLASCATPYQKDGVRGGYTEMKMGQDLYQVSFRGNGYTGASTVQEHFLRRCAELTREQGMDFFALVDQEASSTLHNLGTNHTGSFTPTYGGGMNYSGTSRTSTVSKHGRTGLIKMFKAGSQPQVAFEAKQILSNYEARK